jgi:hypothetical protein
VIGALELFGCGQCCPGNGSVNIDHRRSLLDDLRFALPWARVAQVDPVVALRTE